MGARWRTTENLVLMTTVFRAEGWKILYVPNSELPQMTPRGKHERTKKLNEQTRNSGT